MPQETIEAFQDHGEVALTLEQGLDEARTVFEELEAAGVSTRRRHPRARGGGRAEVRRLVRRAARRDPREARRARRRLIEPAELVERIWERDPTVWTGHDEAHWLGWLDEPLRMRERIGELAELADAAADADDVVLLGMGGSSLAPEVLRRAFERDRFHVLDTTHPKAIRRLADALDLGRTLFVVSSKSGSDARDPLATSTSSGSGAASRRPLRRDHRPGLAARAARARARASRVFAGEPTIGGRYSALSPFGLVPAALMGVDLGAAARPRGGDAERLPRRGRQSRASRSGSRSGPPGRRAATRSSSARIRAASACGSSSSSPSRPARRASGLVPAPARVRTAPTARRARSSSPTRTTSAPSSSAGSSRPRSPARSSRSTRSTSRTSRRRRTGRRRCSSRAASSVEPEGSARGAARAGAARRLRRDPGVRRPRARRSALAAARRTRARATGCVVTFGPRPALPALDRPAAQGRRADRLLPPGRRRHRRGAGDPGQKFGFGRLIEAQAAGDYEALKERGRPVARIRLEDIR